MTTSTTIAWSVTLFCVFFSGRIATAFLKSNPRLFTVMALFACSWAVLLPYYAMPEGVEKPELLSALGGFLSVYAGGLLMLHAQLIQQPPPQQKSQQARDVVSWQVVAVYLLLLVAAQSALAIPAPSGPGPGLTHHQAELVIGFLLVIAGFTSIVLGTRDVAGRRALWILIPILVCYGLLEGMFAWDQWYRDKTTEMPDVYGYLFSAAKAAYTLVFASIVAYKGMPDEDQQHLQSIFHWILIFFYIRMAYHKPHHSA
jgi:hypothetical protein